MFHVTSDTGPESPVRSALLTVNRLPQEETQLEARSGQSDLDGPTSNF